jgi:hypothetical protein
MAAFSAGLTGMARVRRRRFGADGSRRRRRSGGVVGAGLSVASRSTTSATTTVTLSRVLALRATSTQRFGGALRGTVGRGEDFVDDARG